MSEELWLPEERWTFVRADGEPKNNTVRLWAAIPSIRKTQAGKLLTVEWHRVVQRTQMDEPVIAVRLLSWRVDTDAMARDVWMWVHQAYDERTSVSELIDKLNVLGHPLIPVSMNVQRGRSILNIQTKGCVVIDVWEDVDEM